jgi:hypothetical protein
MDPGTTAGGPVEEAIKVEPKGDVDAGETAINVAKRVTLFFVNTTALPVHVDKITLNNDGNVVADISNDDCSKQGTLTPQSRCTVEVSITPTSPGPWNVEMLMTHNGPGRIARAKISGKTSGATDQKKDNGLTLSNKDSGTVAFGDVDVGDKVVRSALMSNDSPDPLTIYSIDVIEADNGLTRLDQGCAIDMELKPGESCPITLLWTPQAKGQISTDLIIRHSGRTGFAVIPVRGTAKGVATTSKGDTKTTVSTETIHTSSNSPASVPMPPSASELARAMKDVPAVSSDALTSSASNTTATAPITRNLRLIGTVGNRAVLIKPDGTTAVASAGDDVSLGEKEVRVTAVNPKSVDILDAGKKKTLILASAQELVDRATIKAKTASSDDKSQTGFGGSANGSFMAPQPTGSNAPPANTAPSTMPNGVAR